MSGTEVTPNDKEQAFVSAYPSAIYFSATVIEQIGAGFPGVSVSVNEGEWIRFRFRDDADWTVSYTDTDRPAGSISGTTPIAEAAGIKDAIGDSGHRFTEIVVDGTDVEVDISEIA